MILSCQQSRSRGFTLIEILVVTAIIAILVGISITAFSSNRGTKLSTAGNLLIDHLNLSRQTAMTKNCLVEFRIYELPEATAPSNSSPTVYRAFQAFVLDSVGNATAINKITLLPDGVMIANDEAVSSLLDKKNPPNFVEGTASGKTLVNFPPSSYNYYAFRFKPNGGTDLSPTATQSWHLSLALKTDPVVATTGLPSNFYTVQIDAQNGRVRSFRPN